MNKTVKITLKIRQFRCRKDEHILQCNSGIVLLYGRNGNILFNMFVKFISSKFLVDICVPHNNEY